MALYGFYPHLSDGHEVRVDDDLRQIVVCPLPGAVEMPYSPNANPEEVVCGHCELMERIEEHPDLPMVRCDHEPDEDPPIAGGSPHGAVHRWDEVQPCKPRLRRIHWCGVFISVDEGVVGDLMEVDRRWREAGGRDFYLVRQEDTGAYACRNSKGHSRAIAVDENWSDGPMVSKRTPCPGEAKRRRFVEACFDPVGWGWGARWRRVCDTMHHSPLPNEGGHGFLYRRHEVTPDPTPPPADDDFEGDVMAKQVLRKGMGAPDKPEPDVKILQALLVAWGIEPGKWFGTEPYGHKPDGIFGAGVKEKLIDWQRYVGLPADGVCDSDDWRKLLLL